MLNNQTLPKTQSEIDKNRVEEGFCVFRNGLISISDWVFGHVWSCLTLFIMKTSHKSDELKKIKKGGSTNRVPMHRLHQKPTWSMCDEKSVLFVSILPLYSIFFIGIWNCPDSGIFLFSFISMRYHYIDIAKIRNKKKYLPWPITH